MCIFLYDGDFISTTWHHLHYSLPRYQLLSPADIQPLKSNLSLQHTLMESIHSDTFTDIDIHVRRRFGNDTTTLTQSFSFASFPCSSTRDRTSDKSPRFAASCTYIRLNVDAMRCVVISYKISHDSFRRIVITQSIPNGLQAAVTQVSHRGNCRYEMVGWISNGNSTIEAKVEAFLQQEGVQVKSIQMHQPVARGKSNHTTQTT